MFFLMLGVAVSVQQVQTGFLDRSITLGGRSYHYQVYVPADYAAKPSWPAILFLHGAGERGADGLLQTNVGLGPAIRQNPSRWPAIAVFPQVPPDCRWAATARGMSPTAILSYSRRSCRSVVGCETFRSFVARCRSCRATARRSCPLSCNGSGRCQSGFSTAKWIRS